MDLQRLRLVTPDVALMGSISIFTPAASGYMSKIEPISFRFLSRRELLHHLAGLWVKGLNGLRQTSSMAFIPRAVVDVLACGAVGQIKNIGVTGVLIPMIHLRLVLRVVQPRHRNKAVNIKFAVFAIAV